MRTRRGKTMEKGSALARLRASGDGPDPRFRAALRERLVAAAGDHRDDHRNHARQAERSNVAD
ncbi:hypothetical protein AGRA3207_004706 [Actinomadura graeca]|uniref:Uncharacterized protein n=1 Tax=Actinomadura graeca TaxID=2750812 RepID=A0ABX8QXS5_9ACTN|nr:hypothetical protein [Actinomadura graeca]QXJ23537.1 hypothetical protein AGRA3207_004706 [Actinomadura graeca]